MLISFSGIDSSGKTTQIELLEQFAMANNVPFIKRWGKARGTPGVVFLKEIMRNDKSMNELEKANYREDFFKDKRRKKLLLVASLIDLCWYFGIYYRLLGLFNKYVILDRYIWDTYVELKTEFEGIDVDRMLLWRFVRFVSPEPNISILFTIPPEISIQRDINKKDLTIDSLQLKKKKINLYVELNSQNTWMYTISGLNPILDVHQKVLQILKFQ